MAGLQTAIRFSLRMNYPDIDDAPLPFELYTEEELEQMAIEQEQDDWERSIPTPADRNPNLK
jgi:hypothetical protein